MPAFAQSKRFRGLHTFFLLAWGALLIGILYFGREILIPIALAILLTFILSPVVSFLRRRRLGRVLSVTITVVLAFLVVGVVTTIIVVELKSLANELPAYRENIHQKISDIRSASKNESLKKVKDIAREIVDELKQSEAAPSEDPREAASSSTNAPVVVQETTTVTKEDPILDSVLSQLGSAGLVVVLVVFMLLRREDLRDRLLHLAGRDRLIATTKAVEEVSRKVSRYLGRLCLLNAIFGIGISIGLFLIGLPYAVLWGFLAGIARFIPYAGPVLGAIAPMLMSLAVFNSWLMPLVVIGLILGWELLNNMILEPVIYGQGIGVSEVALLIMMAFWTWLWGPVGLVLAAPLTVCLAVISKSIPELNFVSLLLDSKASLMPHHALYQRLLAQNHDEALLLVRDFLKDHSRTEMIDSLFLRVLLDCRHDRFGGRLSGQQEREVFHLLRRLLDESRADSGAQPEETLPECHVVIAGCPAIDGADEMALLLLADLLVSSHVFMPVIPADFSDEQKIEEIAALRPSVLCLGSVSESQTCEANALLGKLRKKWPSLPVVVGCWGTVKPPTDVPQTDEFTQVCLSLSGAKGRLMSLCVGQAPRPADASLTATS